MRSLNRIGALAASLWLAFSLAVILSASFKEAFAASSSDPARIVPDPVLTPGAFTNEPLSELCKVGTQDERKRLPVQLKAQIFYRYGITRMSSDDCGYQLDHLVPNGLGGASTIENIWPEPLCGKWNAYDKDRLDRWARREVCGGRMSLQDARDLFQNWIQSYQRIFGEVP